MHQAAKRGSKAGLLSAGRKFNSAPVLFPPETNTPGPATKVTVLGNVIFFWATCRSGPGIPYPLPYRCFWAQAGQQTAAADDDASCTGLGIPRGYG